MKINRITIGIFRSAAYLIVMEVLVFVVAFVAFLLVGILTGGLEEGIKMASGVIYSWVAFVVIGFISWLILGIV